MKIMKNILRKIILFSIRTPINYKVDDIPNKDNINTLGYCFMSGSPIEKFIGWENLAKIGSLAFHSCNQLKSVDLSMPQIKEIPSICFYGCNLLTTILLPVNLTKLSQLRQLYKLESISIPASVTDISDELFLNISRLKVVAYFGKNSFSNRNLFRNCPSKILIRVTKLYPSNLFSNFQVSYDAYELGSQIPIICQTEMNSCYESKFLYMAVFIFIVND